MVNRQEKTVRFIGPRRHFSEEVKREVVKRIERNQLGISQAVREYEVSAQSIYNWIYRYSVHLKKGNTMIVEKKSQTKKIEDYKQRIAELERIVGQKQLELDIANRMLEMGSEYVGFDIKKKYSGKLSSGTASTKPNMETN